MAALDLRAISSAIFLPLLYWTGSVVAITLFGYPGVVCMTPLAWLLALPVGLRVPRESGSPGNGPVIEAAVGGGLLGLWQGLLFSGAMALTSFLPGGQIDELPNTFLLAAITILAGVPVTAGLAAWVARAVRQKSMTKRT